MTTQTIATQANQHAAARALCRFAALLTRDDPETVDAEMLAFECEVSGSRIAAINPDNAWYQSDRMWLFGFGAYGWTRLIVWDRSVEDALETAAEWLAKHEPGHFVDVDVDAAAQELFGKDYADLDEDEQDRAHNEATIDLTYTESGYLASGEWTVDEVDANDVRALLADR